MRYLTHVFRVKEYDKLFESNLIIVIFIVTRSVQPKPPAVAIVRQNGRSSASCRTSVAVTPVSRQIWWVQVVEGRQQARLHSCEGRSPSLDLVQICRIWFAGKSRRSLATCPKRPSLRLRTMYETSNRPVRQQNFIVGHEVVPSDVQDASLVPYMERIQFIPVGLNEGPGLRAIE